MNTQNTPVHIRLWHKNFWCLALAYLFMSVALYSFVPVLPLWLIGNQGMSTWQTALSLFCFGGGIWLSGGFCNFLTQRYRRNNVCVVSVIAAVIILAAHYYIVSEKMQVPLWIIAALRLAFGAVFGMAQMVLSGILVIDVCESYNRTEANYCMSWFYRFGLSLGPIAGVIAGMFGCFQGVLLLAIVCLVVAMMLILTVSFPFRAPDDNVPVFGLDRFFLPQGWLLSVTLLLFAAVVGMVFSVIHSIEFFSMLATGFLLSVIAQRIVFADAELKSEVIAGLLLVGTALLLQVTRSLSVVSLVMPVMMGLGIGLVSGRFLLFFIKLSRHCQRGTSQSTYNISWETGLWTGMAVGFLIGNNEQQYGVNDSLVCSIAFWIVVGVLLLYNFATHKWYLHHKNR